MKNTPIVNHGTLIDSINYEGLIEASSKEPTFLGTPKKVISVKSKSKGKALSKVKRPSQRHR